jgi:predicted alpha/beta superfamily hydrolase
MNRGVAILAVIGLLAGWPEPSDAQVRLVSQHPYAPQGAERLVVHSTATGGDYVVVISPPGALIMAGPPQPSQPSSKGRQPAIYALDGGYGVAGPLAQVLAGAGTMQPAYVVSISYPPGEDGRRNTEFLHRPVTENGQTYGGGGAGLEAFLIRELRPYLEKRYPLDPAKAILLGHSFGGLFAANVLADAPQSFAGYAIGSASAWRDPQLLSRLAAAAPLGQGRRVLVAAGDTEDARMREAVSQIAAALSAPGSTFAVQKKLFPGEGHLSSYPPLAQAAYAWTLFPTARTAVAVSADRLQRLIGVYVYPDGRKLTATRRDDGLHVGMTGIPGDTVVLAESPRRFFIPGGYDVTFEFIGDDHAPPKEVIVRMNGAESRALRAPD